MGRTWASAFPRILEYVFITLSFLSWLNLPFLSGILFLELGMSMPHGEELELSPLRDTPAPLHDYLDFISSIATVEGGVSQFRSPGYEIRELELSEEQRTEPKTGIAASNRILFGHGSGPHVASQRATRRTCKSMDGGSWTWETAAVLLSLVMASITILALALIDNGKLPN